MVAARMTTANRSQSSSPSTPITLLIAAGAPLNHINNLHWTAVLEAVLLGDGGADHQAVLDALLDAGADRTIADRDGVTPLKHAERLGYTEMAARLRAKD